MNKSFYTFVFSVLFLLLLISLSADCSAQGSYTISWIDTNTPPADSFTVFRSESPDDGYLVVASEIEDTVWTDNNLENDVRYWYKVNAIKGYMESEMSNWTSGKTIDLTGGQYDTEKIVAYYPGNEMVLLIIYPPTNDCVIKRWQYMVPDLIRISCESEVLFKPALTIR